MQSSFSSRLVILPLLAGLLLLSGCAPPARFENECGVIVSALESGAAIPTGMRRTKNGWEDTRYWHLSSSLENRSIDAWMEHQRQREPSWVRRLFAKIRTTPPLMVAVLQIATIAAIVHVSRAQKQEPPR